MIARNFLPAARIFGVGLAVAVAGAPLRAEVDWPKYGKRESVYVADQDRVEGNRYLLTEGLDLNGAMTGDLFVMGVYFSMSSDGVLDGDLFGWANKATLDGTIRGDIRVFAQNLSIQGTVEGDVLFFGQYLTLEKGADVHGEVRAFAQDVSVRGRVRGPFLAKGGVLKLDGEFDRDVSLEFDSMFIVPSGAKVLGDLTYSARKLDIDETTLRSIVAGEVTLREEEAKPDVVPKEKSKRLTFGSVFWWFVWLFWAFVSGWIALQLLGKRRAALIDTLNRDPWISLLVGFAGALMVPLGSLVLMVLLFTLPVGLILMMTAFTLLYLAKLPVAFWVGDRLVEKLGRSLAPVWKLLIGLVPMYLLFEVPYFGKFLWWVVTLFGFGCIALAVMRYASGSAESKTSAPATSGAA